VLPHIVSDTTRRSKRKYNSQEEGEAADAVFLLEVLFEARARMYVTRLVELSAAFTSGKGDFTESYVSVVFFHILVFANGRGLGECEASDGLTVAACVTLVVVCTVECQPVSLGKTRK
jgi:hypothetical protein